MPAPEGQDRRWSRRDFLIREFLKWYQCFNLELETPARPLLNEFCRPSRQMYHRPKSGLNQWLATLCTYSNLNIPLCRLVS